MGPCQHGVIGLCKACVSNALGAKPGVMVSGMSGRRLFTSPTPERLAASRLSSPEAAQYIAEYLLDLVGGSIVLTEDELVKMMARELTGLSRVTDERLGTTVITLHKEYGGN